MARALLPMLLLLAFASGKFLGVAEAQMCEKDMGPYDRKCSSICSLAHRGGQGISKVVSDRVVCKCFYECEEAPSPPPPHPESNKMCRKSLGIWGESCRDEDCDSACYSKFPGRDVRGFCDVALERRWTACLCKHSC